MINKYIEYKEKFEYISEEEKIIIKSILNKYSENSDVNTFGMTYNLIPKKMDECRRVFSVNRSDKTYLQYINFIIKNHLKNSPDSCNIIVSKLLSEINNYKYIKLIDMSKYYDTIDRAILGKKIEMLFENSKHKNEVESTMYNVYEEMDNANISLLKYEFSNNASRSRSQIKEGIGIPQGLPISNVLAYLYLEDIESKNEIIHRYVDDIFVLSNNRANNTVKKLILEKKLKLNYSKTRIVDLRSEFRVNILGYVIERNTKNAIVISPSESSYEKQFNDLRQILKEYEYNKNKRRYLRYKVELKITGYFDGKVSLGWLSYYQNINTLSKLKYLDNWIDRNLSELGVSRTYLRSYHSIRNIKETKNKKYLVRWTSPEGLSIIEKKEILISYFGEAYGINSESEIETKFAMLHFNELKKLEEDFGRKS